MNKSDLIYWKKRRDQRSLIPTIRSHKTRAIHFFGAMDVLSENEMGLLKTIEARAILEMTDQELLIEISSIPSDIFGRVSSEELENLKKELKLTPEGVSELKALAKKHLVKKCGQVDVANFLPS